MNKIPETQMDPVFSQKNVNNSITDDYEHNLVTIEPSEMELEKMEEEKKAVQAAEAEAMEKARKE